MHVPKPYYVMQDVPPSYTSLHCAVPVGAVPALTSHVNVPVTCVRKMVDQGTTPATRTQEILAARAGLSDLLSVGFKVLSLLPTSHCAPHRARRTPSLVTNTLGRLPPL